MCDFEPIPRKKRTMSERIVVNTRTSYASAGAQIEHPSTQKALGTVRHLVVGYLTISALTVVAIAVMRNNAAQVNSAVWIHGIIVVASALFTYIFTVRASAGASRSYLRLRVISIVTPAAMVVLIALPDTFPLWMKIEQDAFGLLLIGVAVRVNSKHQRSSFACKQRSVGTMALGSARSSSLSSIRI